MNQESYETFTTNLAYLTCTKLARYSFSLSFKFVQLNFAHLYETYSRSFKFAQLNIRARKIPF